MPPWYPRTLEPGRAASPGLGPGPGAPGRLAPVNTRTAWLVYSALRIVFFAVPFLVLYFIGWHWLLAAVVATLVAVSLSVIFLSKQREVASTSIYDWRRRDRTADDVVVDEAVDTAAAPFEGERAAESAGAAEDPDAERTKGD